MFRRLLCHLDVFQSARTDVSLLFWRHSVVLHTSELEGFFGRMETQFVPARRRVNSCLHVRCHALLHAASVVCISPVFWPELSKKRHMLHHQKWSTLRKARFLINTFQDRLFRIDLKRINWQRCRALQMRRHPFKSFNLSRQCGS